MSVTSSRCIPGTEHGGVQLFPATADDRPVSEGAQQRKRTTRWAGPGLLMEAGLIRYVFIDASKVGVVKVMALRRRREVRERFFPHSATEVGGFTRPPWRESACVWIVLDSL